MLRTLLILPLCLWFTTASAVNLDSLWGVWNDKSQPDTNRLKAMDDISNYGYLYSKPDSAYYFAGLEYDLAEATENKGHMATALNTQGVSFCFRGHYYKALEHFDKCLKILEEKGDKSKIASININIAGIFMYQGNYKQAFEYFEKSLKILEEKGDKSKMAAINNNIGLSNSEQGNYEQALEYYNKSLNLYEEIDDKRGIGISYNNIGLNYRYQGDYERALKYHDKSLKVILETGDKRGMGDTYNNIGGIYHIQGNYVKAIDYYTRSLKIYDENGDRQGIASSLNNIGEIYINQGETAKAIDYSSRALRLAQEVGAVIEIKNAANSLLGSYKETGSFKDALVMHELYIEMRDSINSIENKEAAIKLEYKHAYEKEQVIADAKHQEQMALSAEREKRQELIAYSAGGGLVMVLAFAFFIFNRLQVTRRQKTIIEQQKELVEEQKKDITDSIQYAENIQKALLPAEADLSVLPEGFVLFHPKDIVSGDFYWMQHHNDSVYLAACDCTGHGVPGAFMSMIGSSQLDEAVVEKGFTQPNEIFYEVRKGFINALKQTGEKGQQKDGMDATLIAWDKKNKLQYAVANNPFFLIRKGELLETKPDRQPVGFHTGEQKPFTHHEHTLEKGDTVYIFSDGYHDQFGGPKDKKFMMKNFKKLLLSIQDKSMNEQKTILETTMSQWKGDTEQVDDILVMGLRF